MKFTHLVEINDPLNPLIDTLTREQLWRGLMLRATEPRVFVPWLDRCRILEQTEDELARELHYGTLVVRDRVHFFPQRQVIYEVPPQHDIPASRLTVTIEEPETGIYFVRFEYEDEDKGAHAADGANTMYEEMRRSAYQESDIDTIRVIRQMAEEGRLDAPPV